MRDSIFNGFFCMYGKIKCKFCLIGVFFSCIKCVCVRVNILKIN